MKTLTNLLMMAALVVFATGCGLDEGVSSTSKLDRSLDDKEVANLNLKFEFSMETVQGAPRLLVKESFIMPRERLYLRLPERYLRKENLYQRIEDLTVSSPGKLSDYEDMKSVRVLEHPVGKEVSLQYYYRPDDPVSYSLGKESFSAPLIRDEYFQFVGSMVLIYPVAIVGAKSFTVDLNWDLPTGFRVFNSYGALDNTQRVTTDFDKLRDSFFVAGRNIRAYQQNVRGNPVWVTFEGRWKEISDAQFVNAVTRLIATQRKVFDDDKFPYFLVNFLAEDLTCVNKSIKFAGTAHPNSFRAVFPGGPACVFKAEMRQLISHELIHMWIGKKTRVGEESGHIDGKWFTEGFTDFFGRLVAYQAGVLTEKEYFSSLNRQLEKYYTSQERKVTLKELVARMYRRGQSNRELEDVPYQQGEILAWRLNKEIKQATSFSSNLLDVVKDMVADADKAGGYKKFTVADISEYVGRYAPRVFDEEYAKIVDGELLMPPVLDQCSMPTKSFVTEHHMPNYRFRNPLYTYRSIERNCKRWLD